MNILVYGTLMQGGGANSMLGKCKYISRAVTAGLSIKDLGTFPAAYKCEHEAAELYGDLYRLPEDQDGRINTLRRLYLYEGNTYQYEDTICTAFLSIEQQVRCGIFVANGFNSNRLGIASWSPFGIAWDGVDTRSYRSSLALGV